MRTMVKLAGIAALVLALTLPQAAQAGTLKVHGSSTFGATVMDKNKAALEKATGATLDVVTNGSANGVEDLLTGAADIAMTSAPLDALKDKVKAPGFDSLQAADVAIGRAVLVVNKANTVEKLTLDQVKGLLTGKIANWKEVGGADVPVSVVAEKQGGGFRSFTEKKIAEAPLGGTMKEMSNAPQLVKVAAQIPGAIGVAPAAVVDGSVKTVTVEGVEWKEPLFLVTKGAPAGEAQKLVDAVKALGIK